MPEAAPLALRYVGGEVASVVRQGVTAEARLHADVHRRNAGIRSRPETPSTKPSDKSEPMIQCT